MGKRMRMAGLFSVFAVFMLFAGQCLAGILGIDGKAYTLSDATLSEDAVSQETHLINSVDYYGRYVNVRFNETYIDDDTDEFGKYYLTDGFGEFNLLDSQYILKVTDGGVLNGEENANNGVSPFVDTYTIPSFYDN